MPSLQAIAVWERRIRNASDCRIARYVAGMVRAGESASGRELEFIVRSLVELKLQVEELRRRTEERRVLHEGWVGEVGEVRDVGRDAAAGATIVSPIEPRDTTQPANVVTVTPGMTMADIEKAAIQSALRETRGNRRKAADMLGIGERTLYRKLREYNLAPGAA